MCHRERHRSYADFKDGSGRSSAAAPRGQTTFDIPKWGDDEDDDPAEITRLFERRNDPVTD